MNKIKSMVLLLVAVFVFGFALSYVLWAEPTQILPVKQNDTTAKVDTSVLINVKDKTALYIGDSHTANHANGWQKQLSDTVGFKMINASVGGKTTYWMLEQAVYKINDKIDYCFVYGGANDMYSSGIKPQSSVDNIKGIASICRDRGVKCIVLTGFDAKTCTRSNNVNYPSRYAEFQRLLMRQDINGAVVVDTRVVDRRDCWDYLCHMAPSGHKKIANKIIKDLKFKKI
jgi:hypothetical protein